MHKGKTTSIVGEAIFQMSVQVRHISDFLEHWAPASTSLDYDNVGLLVGSSSSPVHRILTCLDVTHEVVDEAIELSVDLIVAHHPIIFKKLSRITKDNSLGSLLYKLISNNISVFAFHTNFDAALHGVSSALARQLKLQNIEFLQQTSEQNIGFGAIGLLSSPMNQNTFLNHVSECLSLEDFRFSGSLDEISRVAVCGGTGSFLISDALRQHAHAFITADIKYHEYFVDSPFLLVDIGHYESEIGAMDVVAESLTEKFPSVQVHKTAINTNPMRYFKSTKTPTQATTLE